MEPESSAMSERPTTARLREVERLREEILFREVDGTDRRRMAATLTAFEAAVREECAAAICPWCAQGREVLFTRENIAVHARRVGGKYHVYCTAGRIHGGACILGTEREQEWAKSG